jgi:hypothetical protein
MNPTRSPFFLGFVGLILAAFVVASGWLIWSAALETHAPRDPGVCWIRGADGQLATRAKGLSGIDFCVGELERLHMKTGQPVQGAYQGHFIFIDNEAIRSADTLTHQRWRLYFDNQRQDLDKSLNAHEMTFSTQR